MYRRGVPAPRITTYLRDAAVGVHICAGELVQTPYHALDRATPRLQPQPTCLSVVYRGLGSSRAHERWGGAVVDFPWATPPCRLSLGPTASTCVQRTPRTSAAWCYAAVRTVLSGLCYDQKQNTSAPRSSGDRSPATRPASTSPISMGWPRWLPESVC